MQFPNSYFEHEVRDGFYVPSMMKRVWAVQLEILEEIDKICNKHNIPYFADWGTLLGAVRHSGYIPWDDDMDISMKREDYKRFVAVVQKELPEGYLVLNKQSNPEYKEMFTRVVNSTQINLANDFLEKFHGCPYVLGIDVFPLDYIAPNTQEEAYRCEMIQMVQTVIAILEAGNCDVKLQENYLKGIEQICNVTINRAESLCPQLYRILEGLYSLYTDAEAEELTLMSRWLEKRDLKIPKRYYQNTIRIPFENTKIPVPAQYDAILKQKYGNYMRLVKGGSAHDYPFYRGQEMVLEQRLGRNPFRYVFSAQDMQNAQAERRKSYRSLIREQLAQLEQLSIGIDKSNELLFALEQCQNAAIQLGTLIEEIKGEGTESVRLLEQYCEIVYQVYNQLAQGCRAEEVLDDKWNLDFRELVAQVKECVKQEVDIRHKVLFLPYKAKHWDSLESVWMATEKNPECEAYVIPIPYFYKNPNGSVGEMCYEANQYPDYVPITKYVEYDFENNIPEMIYIQNPYDEYDSCIMVHPFFYASNLKKYTEKLIYIPEMLVDECEATDECAMINLRHYCVTPGVIFADRVYVQSESMRKLYINFLTEAAGKDTQTIWEEKIYGIGVPKEDAKNCLSQTGTKMPKEWRWLIEREDGSRKRVILYYTGLSGFMQYKEQMIVAIREVFQTFLEHREDIVMLWKPQSLIKMTLEQEEPKLYEEYCLLENEYCKQKMGILAENLEDQLATTICDAYYGDVSPIVQQFRNAGKPVLVQKIE